VLEEIVPRKKNQPPRALPLPSGGPLREFRRRLLAWFRGRQRPLPWRKTHDPYRIWISEVMLQQTRVAAVLPFYNRFLESFPNVRALARAPSEAVLEAWAGLGYYSRARNLQRAAQEIVRNHRGRFPKSLNDALALPGVGQYTAAAVLSIAYHTPLAVLDGNVARVLARLAAVRGDLRLPERWRQLEAAAQVLLPSRAIGTPRKWNQAMMKPVAQPLLAVLSVRSPGAWNQAMMELGATVCTPRAPTCGECPVARYCRARAMGLQDQIPEKRVKRAPVIVRLAAAVLLDAKRRTLLVRPQNGAGDGLFSRMWQFPALEVTSDPELTLRRHLRESLGIDAAECIALSPARHTVTFRRITLLPFLVPVEVLPGAQRSRTAATESTQIALAEVERWPTSSATRKIARAALRGGHAAL
jgi:A/G-specific adenine glycosylase